MDVYTTAELRAKIASNEYGAEHCLQHAMANIEALEMALEALRKDAERYRKLVASGKYCAASIGGGWGLGGKSTKAQLDAAADALPAVGAA